jgi:hypothetical protein
MLFPEESPPPPPSLHPTIKKITKIGNARRISFIGFLLLLMIMESAFNYWQIAQAVKTQPEYLLTINSKRKL